MRKVHRSLILLLATLLLTSGSVAAQIKEMWDKNISDDRLINDNVKWFSNAKFGLFIHWGLFAQHAGEWQGKKYFGISEWVMNRGKIPADQYVELMHQFNPTKFNADEWVRLSIECGIKYMVITSKHHEGFAMFNSKVSPFNILNTPFKRDPLKELSIACQKHQLKLGFYYSQFLDWHEPNGGGNSWDFVEKNKNYKAYYDQKAIPQIKELLTGYGPLGLLWFDMPGGLSKEETHLLISDIKKIQPNCLLSSRVGQGLGDFRDFGDGEIPSGVVKGPWEAIFTHNDSWGYSKFDFNFKTPSEIIRLLANISSKGGNLLLNIGPKSDGTFPEESVRCLKAVGGWLKINGDAIYETTYGPIAPQPWGVTTLKPGKLYIHVLNPPVNQKLIVPGIDVSVKKVSILSGGKKLEWMKNNNELTIELPFNLPDKTNTVIIVEYEGSLSDSSHNAAIVVSPHFDQCNLDVSHARFHGESKIETITHSNYFGDWKHMPCATNMQNQGDSIVYNVNFIEPGDYKIILEYSCPIDNSKQQGLLEVGDENFYFETLATGDHNAWRPLMFIQQSVAMVTISRAGIKKIKISPLAPGKELFKLSRIAIQPFK